MNWTEGYFTGLDYTHGYYREMNPAMLRLTCIAAGIQPPPVKDPVYLELGFGQGVSINVHAAASGGAFWGTDFNPSHAAHAATLADASGADLCLFDDSFAEFAARDDLPIFDFIVLHGVWSWISERNRSLICDIVRNNLRVGGLVCLSYNCQPGWAAQMPVRHLMAQHMRYAGSEIGGAAGQIDGALRYVQKVAASGAAYFTENPVLEQFVRGLQSQNRNYLGHEYLNQDWNITTFADVAASLSEAKLSFAAAARLLDHIDEFSMDLPTRQLIADIEHPLLKQTVRDYVVNQKFRMDIFVKGPRQLVGIEARTVWNQERFTLTVPKELTKLEHSTPVGDLELDEHIYGPLIEALAARRYVAKTISELCEFPGMGGFDVRKILSALLMLTGLGYVQPARIPTDLDRKRCDALNQHLCQRALATGDISVLASPVLGGGKHAPQDHQMVILARLAGMTTPTDQALYLNAVFEANGGDLMREGKRVQMGDEAIAQFKGLAEKFEREGHAPLLAALEILPARDVSRPHREKPTAMIGQRPNPAGYVSVNPGRASS
ncbi:methyltransferase regulatory domain-containing protein [Sphingomonas prati]|uniref:Methyltransferase regulatory domain-containing protein n=1 Tax=Sphingomonas prati TaxID=1843237 RepID=A0A7W9F1A5_9SPHN|nr:methyltransferase regulatory domain-containing protein [Sphingomonas prati]MBB5729046.1 hypothetical protein [Sphingomonas prati]GGE85498.1 hypothetical protein GCM10011404_17860 [Sphingomonas prati]